TFLVSVRDDDGTLVTDSSDSINPAITVDWCRVGGRSRCHSDGRGLSIPSPFHGCRRSAGRCVGPTSTISHLGRDRAIRRPTPVHDYYFWARGHRHVLFGRGITNHHGGRLWASSGVSFGTFPRESAFRGLWQRVLDFIGYAGAPSLLF